MHALEPAVRNQARNEPGVYRFIGPRGDVLYVGKSIRLRTRLLDHFRSTRTRTRELLRVACGVEWDTVPSELEALVLEFRQIRMFRPRFNVRHRRERRWAWIRVTREAAPRVVASRQPPPDSLRVIGPFPGTRNLPRTLRDLAHATGVRDCPADQPIRLADQLDLLPRSWSPGCPRATFGSCPAPCAGQVSRERYMEGVHEAIAFLDGRSEAPLEHLRRQMHAASRRNSFESAARWRDRHDRLLKLRQRILGHQDLMDRLTVVVRTPDGAAGGGASRLLLLVGARLRASEPEPPPGTPAARALADRFRTLLHDLPGPVSTPAAPTPEEAGSREERFVVAEWFRTRDEEREPAESPDQTLARLEGAGLPRGAEGPQPDSAMARISSNSAGLTG